MSLAELAIEKNRVTWAALFAILVAGAMAYVKMPRSEDPGFIIRNAVVMTWLPGASPERIEQLVTDKLEKVIQEIPELDQVRSDSKPGVSVVIVDIREEVRDIRPIWDNLRRKVDRDPRRSARRTRSDRSSTTSSATCSASCWR